MNEYEAKILLQQNGWNDELIDRFIKTHQNSLSASNAEWLLGSFNAWFKGIVERNVFLVTRNEKNELTRAYVEDNDGIEYDTKVAITTRRLLSGVEQQSTPRPYHDNDHEYYATIDRLNEMVRRRVVVIVNNYIARH